MTPSHHSSEDRSVPSTFDNDFFDRANLDELWPCLFGDDLSQVYLSGAELDLLNTHLLGLPQSVQTIME